MAPVCQLLSMPIIPAVNHNQVVLETPVTDQADHQARAIQ